MAALIGVPIDRTIAATFAIGSGLAGMAGVFAAAEYGVVNFHMGTLMGFKALTAALLGGIGSLPGAALGGFVIALTECYTAAFFGSEWKDIAVFAVLVLVLLFRPAGMLRHLRSVPADERPDRGETANDRCDQVCEPLSRDLPDGRRMLYRVKKIDPAK